MKNPYIFSTEIVFPIQETYTLGASDAVEACIWTSTQPESTVKKDKIIDRDVTALLQNVIHINANQLLLVYVQDDCFNGRCSYNT